MAEVVTVKRLVADTISYLYQHLPDLAHLMMTKRQYAFSCWHFLHGSFDARGKPQLKASLCALTEVEGKRDITHLKVPWVWEYVKSQEINCDTDLVIVAQWGTKFYAFVLYPPDFVLKESTSIETKQQILVAKERIRLDNENFYNKVWRRFVQRMRPDRKREESQEQTFARLIEDHCKQINQMFSMFHQDTVLGDPYTFSFQRLSFQRLTEGPHYSPHIYQLFVLNILWQFCPEWKDPAVLAPLLHDPTQPEADHTTALAEQDYIFCFRVFPTYKTAKNTTKAYATREESIAAAEAELAAAIAAAANPESKPPPVAAEGTHMDGDVVTDETKTETESASASASSDAAKKDDSKTETPPSSSSTAKDKRKELDNDEFWYHCTKAFGLRGRMPLYGEPNAKALQALMKNPESQALTYLSEQTARLGIVAGFVVVRNTLVNTMMSDMKSGFAVNKQVERCRVYRLFITPFIFAAFDGLPVWDRVQEVIVEHAKDTGCTSIDLACYTDFDVVGGRAPPFSANLINSMTRHMFSWPKTKPMTRSKKVSGMDIRLLSA